MTGGKKSKESMTLLGTAERARLLSSGGRYRAIFSDIITHPCAPLCKRRVLEPIEDDLGKLYSPQRVHMSTRSATSCCLRLSILHCIHNTFISIQQKANTTEMFASRIATRTIVAPRMASRQAKVSASP